MDAGAEAQEQLAERIVAEGLSVRATEEAVTLANRYPEDEPKPAPQKRKPIYEPGLDKVAERLADSFDTRVTVSMGKKKGRIVVEFGSVDDLERIVGMMEQQQRGSEFRAEIRRDQAMSGASARNVTVTPLFFGRTEVCRHR